MRSRSCRHTHGQRCERPGPDDENDGDPTPRFFTGVGVSPEWGRAAPGDDCPGALTDPYVHSHAGARLRGIGWADGWDGAAPTGGDGRGVDFCRKKPDTEKTETYALLTFTRKNRGIAPRGKNRDTEKTGTWRLVEICPRSGRSAGVARSTRSGRAGLHGFGVVAVAGAGPGRIGLHPCAISANINE